MWIQKANVAANYNDTKYDKYDFELKANANVTLVEEEKLIFSLGSLVRKGFAGKKN